MLFKNIFIKQCELVKTEACAKVDFQEQGWYKLVFLVHEPCLLLFVFSCFPPIT